MSQGTLIGRGSSKDLYADAAYPQHVFFEFSDRVSVFDYGALPDLIPHKGESLERAARVFFKWCEEAGLATAYDPKVSADAKRFALRAAKHPKFPLPAGLTATLEFLPLEVIFRWGVVPGSSLLKRDPSLKAYTRFEKPRIEFTTKLEASDRGVDRNEATQLAGSADKLGALEAYAVQTATLLRDRLKACGLELWDGKIECAWDAVAGKVVMVDALTPDELRVTLPGLEGIPLSKELLRSWIGGTNWAFDIRYAKAQRGAEWKQQVGKPPRLGAWRLEKLGGLYDSFATALESGTAKALLSWCRTDARAPQVHLIGSGGREDALKWRLELEGCRVVADAASADVVWVSPDAELVAGVVDDLEAQGHWVYGPRKAAALVEGSKSFGKEIARAAGVTIAESSENVADLRKFSEPPVVKYDGLAAGKGVVVPSSWEEADAAVRELSTKGKILFEERLHGFEASAFYAVESGYNGTMVRFLGTARDFKRRFPGDEGPNTGGMGAHAPHPEVTPEDASLFRNWAQSTANVLAARGIPFNGVLYLGNMHDNRKGWALLEYNARFGDPETEALVCGWPDGAPVLRSLLKLSLKQETRDVEVAHTSLCLALVRKEYPGAAPKIDLPPWDFKSTPDCAVFKNAGSSGRVGFIVGRGGDLLEAGDRVFDALVSSPWKPLLDWRADILP